MTGFALSSGADFWLNHLRMNRRQFLKSSAASASSLVLVQPLADQVSSKASTIAPVPAPPPAPGRLPDLTPARWIWYPSGRTLQNTFILFRKPLKLSAVPRRARGWICADSRYRLEVNGTRIQWGPAPCDPRWAEADPIDLTSHLRDGTNVLGATVLFFGVGDGTWPLGKPGFLFWLEIEHQDGRLEKIVSDATWESLLCRAWRPGRPKRWYLRALQEEFDANLYPHGWATAGFAARENWLPAMPLDGSPNKPALSTSYYEYMLDVGSGPNDAQLRARSIPLLDETFVSAEKLAQTFWFDWKRPAEDYFDFRVPDSYEATAALFAIQAGPGEWQFEMDGKRAATLTFEFTDQVVGWPGFVIDAPAGTVIELLVHEAHASSGPPLLNTHFESWTRFICREGRNEFETFDFESLRWLQLHIRNARGTVVIRDVRVRRRKFPWPNQPLIRTSEPDLQRLFDASLNTLHNSAQETLVDGMARERQQYSGDGGHQLHAVHLAFGEPRLVARYLTTFSQGMTKDGYFLDCWPAYDRLARLVERQFDLSGWGPILDHGVGFNFDCWSHYLYTGDLEALREPYPRLVRFARYLQSITGPGGLLPVENIGIPSVWIDHVAFQRQQHKQCAFNLYAAAAMQHALAPMCRAFGDAKQAEAVDQFGAALLRAATQHFWSAERGMFVDNLPWLAEEKSVRTCDRALATSVLFDQCPDARTTAALQSLVDCPPDMGFSYPANAPWRMWALAKGGRADIIVAELRTRWATMVSVKENNTLQEDWTARHDSGQQWSHCAVAPVFMAFHGLMGLRPIQPGFKQYELRPQFGNLADLELVAWTVQGPIHLRCRGQRGNREINLSLPPDASGEIVLSQKEQPDLPETGVAPVGHRRYQLPSGSVTLKLAHA